MGLDLSILPAYGIEAKHSSDVLMFDRDLKLLNLINIQSNLFGVEVESGGVNTLCCMNDEYEELHYGPTEFDPYGDKLKYVLAKYLKGSYISYSNLSWKNKAIFAFINELPDNLPIYLFWS